MSSNTGFRISLVYGGSGFITNTGEIEERPHIVIATPGRLADLVSSGLMYVCMCMCVFVCVCVCVCVCVNAVGVMITFFFW